MPLILRDVLRTGLVVLPMLLAATCRGSNSADLEPSVRGDGETGRYEATVTNNTDTDVYVSCWVTALADYGGVGSDRFLLRTIAGETTSSRGTVSLDDHAVRFEIECAEDLRIDAQAVGLYDENAARKACAATARFRLAARNGVDATPRRRSRMAGLVLFLARRSQDPALIAASERLLDNANTNDGNVWIGMFEDEDDACEALGLDAFKT